VSLIAFWLIVDLLIFYLNSNEILQKNELVVLLLITFFIISQLVLIFTSDNLIVAIFGDTQRRNGFLCYFSAACVFLYVYKRCKIQMPVFLYQLLLVTSVPVLIYGLAQIQGKDFVNWINPYNSAITTFGNPNYTSAFLALIVLCSFVMLTLKEFQASFKVFALIILSLSVIIIVNSQSRQGIYAIVVGVIVYSNIWAFLNKIKIRYILSGASFFLIFFSISGMLQKGFLADYLYKDSVSVRGFYWRAGIEMLKDYPFTGVGLDSYGYYFRRYKEMEYVTRFGSDLTSTNAHNTFIQYFSTGGIILGCTFTFIVLYTIYSALKFIVKSQNVSHKKNMLGLLTIYTGFLAQSFISIDAISLSIWGWTLSGAIIGFSQQNEVKNFKNNAAPRFNPVKNLFHFKPILRFVVLAPILYICLLLYRSESDMYLLRGIVDPAKPENKSETYTYAQKILNNPIADPFLKLKSALYLGDMGYFSEGRKVVEDALTREPFNYECLWALALFQTSNNESEKALSTRLRISKIDPFNTNNYYRLAELYKILGNEAQMRAMQEIILKIAPNGVDAKAISKLLGT
jgi:O-antigen ligase